MRLRKRSVPGRVELYIPSCINQGFLVWSMNLKVSQCAEEACQSSITVLFSSHRASSTFRLANFANKRKESIEAAVYACPSYFFSSSFSLSQIWEVLKKFLN
jgi:hypothetical protein